MITGGFGGAVVLIAVGAILCHAIVWEPASLDIGFVGLILIIVGVAMILLTLLFAF